MTVFESTPIETFVKPMKDENGSFDFTEVDRAQARNYIQGSKIQMVRVITPAGTSAQEVKITDGVETLLINSDGSINTSDFFSNLYRNGTRITHTSATIGTKYTVPANKKFILLQYSKSIDNFQIKNSGGTVIMDITTANSNNQMTFIELQAGDYIHNVAASNITFFGYEIAV